MSHGKRGQVSVFIILGLLILVVLVLLFSRDAGFDTIFSSQTPYDRIESCVQTSIEEGLGVLSKQGGGLDPENFILYEDNKVEYLCYSENDLENCVVQKPLLTASINKELKKYANPRIKSCLEGVRKSLESDGYEVSMRVPEVEVEIVPDNVLVDMDLGLRVEKSGVENFENVKVGVKSKIYNFAIIANSIMQWETLYGDSETLNYMVYYPSIKVEKKKQGDGTTVYILTDRETDESFYFAVRSLAIPPGFIV